MLIKYLSIPALILTSLTSKCGKENKSLASVPDCIKEQIEIFQSQPVQNPPAAIWQFDYNHNKAY